MQFASVHFLLNLFEELFVNHGIEITTMKLERSAEFFVVIATEALGFYKMIPSF